MTDTTVRTDIAKRIIIAAEQCSMPRRDLFRFSGVDTDLFPRAQRPSEPPRTPGGYLSMATVFRLWDVVASKLAGADALNAASKAVPLAKLGEFGFMCMTAPTVLHALEKICWSFSLLTDSGRWCLRLQGDRCKLVWDRVPSSVGQCFSNEALIAQFFDNISGFSGARLPVVEVQLAHRQIDSSRALRDVLDAPVRCDAPETSLSMPRDFLFQTPTHANEDLFEYFVGASQRLLSERSRRGGLPLRLQHAILECLAAGDLSEKRVAERLGLTPRSLQRQLATRATSYKSERDRVLKERARGLLLMTRRPLADIADTLGFSEPSAFSHAFRRWFGVTPRSMRQSAC